MYSNTKVYSHIYIEKQAETYPSTQRILNRFPNAERIYVENYQSVFGRGGQSFAAQKKSQNLILAVKKDQFLYSGNTFIQSDSAVDFQYNALVLNCPYDCQYCYLQGMYNSANLVVFVNLEDYFEATETYLKERPNQDELFVLAISYDTDLLALESITGYAERWMQWAETRDNVLVEIRTKSIKRTPWTEMQPHKNVLFSWTLSPEVIAKRYEWLTPRPALRMKAMKEAIDAGWQVRLCLDPVLRVQDWENSYDELIDQVETVIGIENLFDVHVGVFRLSTDYFKKMKRESRTDLLHYPYEHATNIVSYDKKDREGMMNFMRDRLKKHLPEEKIILWT